jgi:dTDP-4-amino-4,6-dideoxygalactose transaminase
LTTADGGLLITPDAESYKRGKLMRWFGLDREAGASFRCIQDITEYGFKYHLHDVGAAIGLSNLPHMSQNVLKLISERSLSEGSSTGWRRAQFVERGSAL